MCKVLSNAHFKIILGNKLVHNLFYCTQVTNVKENFSSKVVHTAIIGAPNSGKSTLINSILDRKICASSNKVHTTTKLVRAMCFQDDTQIIFLDTPGVVTENEKKKYKLPTSMIEAYHKSLRCCDVVGVVHDISNSYTKHDLHRDVVEILQYVKGIPSFLIINKIDKLQTKRQLLSVIRNLTNGIIAGNPVPDYKSKSDSKRKRGYSHFSDVFLVSALNGDGVKDIKDYLLKNAKSSAFHYSPDMWSDQKPEYLIEQSVRAKFLDFLSHEIPYNLTTRLEYYEKKQDENKIVCSVVVECPSERLMKLVNGAGGGRLQQIKCHVRDDLINMFQIPVLVDIQLKVKGKENI